MKKYKKVGKQKIQKKRVAAHTKEEKEEREMMKSRKEKWNFEILAL